MDEADLRFWELYAQVAPVVMIALAIEARVLSRSVSATAPLRARLVFALVPFGPLVALAWAEGMAIMAMTSNGEDGSSVLIGQLILILGIGAFAGLCGLDVLGRAVPDVLVRAAAPLWWGRLRTARAFWNVKRTIRDTRKKLQSHGSMTLRHQKEVDALLASSGLTRSSLRAVPHPGLQEAIRASDELDAQWDVLMAERIDWFERLDQLRILRPLYEKRSQSLRAENVRQVVIQLFGE